MIPPFSYVRPTRIKDAVGHLRSSRAYAHAGGTDLLGCLRENILEADTVVSLSAISQLRGIRATADGGLRIGPLTTITEISKHPVIRERYPGLSLGASEVASPQLRNQGTIGGNLCQKPRCWYYRGEFHCLRKGGTTCFAQSGENQYHCIFGSDGLCYIVHPSDTAPALIALGAALEITGPSGKCIIPVSEFHVPPRIDPQRETILESGELITEIRLPPPPKGLRSSYRKVRARRAWDFALAGVALALQFEGDRVVDGRVVLSGAAPIPWRSKPAEQAILGTRLEDRAIAEASEAVVQEAEPLEKNGYKIPLFRGIMEEALHRIKASSPSGNEPGDAFL